MNKLATMITHLLVWGVIACQNACESPPPAVPSTPEQVAPAHQDATWQSDQASIDEILIDQEVQLHAALYRAAYRASVGGLRHFILVPALEDQPPDLGIDPAEFRNRVLDQLRDLQAQVAWAEDLWRVKESFLFPDTNESAARLSIEIHRRDVQRATVVATVQAATAESGSARQHVSAEWDGRRWNVFPDQLRVTW